MICRDDEAEAQCGAGEAYVGVGEEVSDATHWVDDDEVVPL